jgi:rhodanese-related sulfurtransferase
MAKVEQIGEATFENLTPDEVRARLDQNEIVLIDVRTPQEYAFEHIPGAMLFPMATFDAHKLPQQDDKPIVFHCGSGKRSTQVAKQCAEVGIRRLAHMEGGFGAWKKAEHPYISIDPATGSYVRKP